MFWQSTLIKKPRKLHKCFGCGKQLRFKHWREKGVWEGQFSDYRLCLGCRRFLDKNAEYKQDGFFYGELRDGRKEYARERR